MQCMGELSAAVSLAATWIERVAALHTAYRSGEIHAYVPEELHEGAGTLDDLIQQHLPASHAALAAASHSLFFSLPVAFDPGESIGPYLAIVDRDGAGKPY